MEPLAGWIVGDNGQCATVLEEVTRPVAVIARISEAGGRRRQRREQTMSWPVIADLPAGDGKSNQSAGGIGYAVDFGPWSAS